MSARPAPVWPSAEFSRIAHLRVLAAGLPGTVIHECVIDAPFDDVWGWVSDLEHSVPAFDRTVGSVELLGGEGTRRRARTTVRWLPGRFGFDVDLDDGWCWMVSRPGFYVVGMAAEAEGERTRWAHLEGVAIHVRWRPLRWALRPILRVACWRHHRHVRNDVEGIVRHVTR